MKITIEATDKLTWLPVPGYPGTKIEARVWNGITDKGTRCLVFVPQIAVLNQEDASQFAKELEERPEPEGVTGLGEVLARHAGLAR